MVGAPTLRRLAVALAAVSMGAAAAEAVPAEASPRVLYGVQDDAWLVYGAGPIDSRMRRLRRLGVDVVRFTIRWDEVARRRPRNGRNHRDRAYRWRHTDRVLRALRRHRIEAVVTFLGTPRWANGRRHFSWVPTDERWFANFVYAAARRYPWVKRWTIWNEPNQRRWLRPTSARVYVRRLLNPAYEELHAAIRGVEVAGGMTAPRASAGGVSPVAWIRRMSAAGARLDAYAHHPYPTRPQVETPWWGGCRHCSTITMADLRRLLRETRRAFGPTRLWLTEYGYQTNPPDRILGVPWADQAKHLATAAHKAYVTARVDMLINFMVRDDGSPDGWQSGFFTIRGARKPAYAAFRFPLTQVSRRGSRVRVWGQIRPRSGPQRYRLRARPPGGRWRWVGRTSKTDEGGVFRATVPASRGWRIQLWSPRDRRFGLPLEVR